MYKLNYLVASDTESLEKSIELLYATNDEPAILEVFTPTFENDIILKQYFKELI